MEGPNSNNIEETKMTPQKMMEEIQKAYPSSHLFLQEIIEAGDNNWGTSSSPDEVKSIIVKLAQYHRAIIHREYTFDIKEPEEKEKKMYERGLWLGSMAAAVYYGELTMIDKDGKLLQKPEPVK
jgi:hypothetical protein